ncbi:MAG: sugar ABC transporter ATP-binding protein [Spirochaetales bacterium]|nr:sugar ABC transporter ATP-binding protein [Spirochaetales bacterium]
MAGSDTTSDGSIVEFRNIKKAFPGVVALDDVSFSIRRGEIHALVGENGAGKSTLVKVLTGVVIKDAGEIYLDGELVSIRHAKDAIKLGVRCIYQELPLADALSVADNIFLGQELRNGLLIKKSAQHEYVKKYFGDYDLELDPTFPVGKLSVSMRQIVAIIKATMTELKVLLMDEPTATLGEKETKTLFDFMRRMRHKGLSILYISHRLDEVFEIADRVTVLRDGLYKGTKRIKDISKDELIALMSGKDIHDSSLVYDSTRDPKEAAIVEVDGLCYRNLLKNVSFSVREGEIFGICGLVGAGKTELLKCIAGVYRSDTGKIVLDGRDITGLREDDEVRTGTIGLVPEDRKGEGLFLDLDVVTNISIASLRRLLRLVFIRRKKEAQLAAQLISDLDIKVNSPRRAARFLSGGNQQKVVFAKWVSAGKKFLMLDEPTRGVDVFGKTEIYRLINKLARAGMSILISSSEIPEVLGICDRIGVMHDGEMVRVFTRAEFSKEGVLRAMIANNQ